MQDISVRCETFYDGEFLKPEGLRGDLVEEVLQVREEEERAVGRERGGGHLVSCVSQGRSRRMCGAPSETCCDEETDRCWQPTS